MRRGLLPMPTLLRTCSPASFTKAGHPRLLSPSGAHGGQIACEEDLMTRVFASWEKSLSASRPPSAVAAKPVPKFSSSAPLPRLMRSGASAPTESFTRFRPMVAPARQESEGGPGPSSGQHSGVQHDAPYDDHLPDAAGQCYLQVGEMGSRGKRSPATLDCASDAAAVAMQAADASVWKLPPDSVSPGAGSLCMAGLRLGQFRLKGSATLAMVNVTPTALAARR